MYRIKIVKSTNQYLPNFYYFILVFLILFKIFCYFYISSEMRDLITIIGVSIAIFAFIINTYNLIINRRLLGKNFMPNKNVKNLQN